jgi:hypothetical protein
MYHTFFIQSSVVKNLGWFHNLAIENVAAIKMAMQLSLLDVDLHF